MMMFVILLLVFGIFKCSAEVLTLSNLETKVDCDHQYSSTIPSIRKTNWGPHNIYPVLICVKFNLAVTDCGNLPSSGEITLMMDNIGWEESDKHEFKPSALKSNEHCHVFDARDINKNLQGKDLTGTTIGASAAIVNTQGVNNAPATFQLFLTAVPYLVNAPMAGVTAQQFKLHSVVCIFPDCVVSVKPPHTIASSYRFTIKEGETPKYEEGDGPLTKGMFSVTTIVCESECRPEIYILQKGSTESTAAEAAASIIVGASFAAAAVAVGLAAGIFSRLYFFRGKAILAGQDVDDIELRQIEQMPKEAAGKEAREQHIETVELEW